MNIQRPLGRILLLMVCMALFAPPCARAETLTICSDTRVYAEPDTDSDSWRVEKGTQAKLVEYGTGKYSGWVRIQNPANGKIFYIKAKYITGGEKEEETEEDCESMYVLVDDLPLYEEKSTSAGRIRSLSRGRAVDVYEVKGGWAKVQYKSARGYVQAAGLARSKPGSTQTLYAAEEAGVYKEDSSSSGRHATVKAGTKMKVYSVNGNWCLVANNGAIGYMKKSQLSTEKPGSGDIILADWFESNIRSVFSIGTRATITDVDSGISWSVVRKGGTNHADVEPRTEADTAAMLKACGDSSGNWTYERHAVWVTVGGKRYAASVYTEPHGDDTIANNNYPGHFCVHFLNSRTHGTDRVDEQHQNCVKKAYRAG